MKNKILIFSIIVMLFSISFVAAATPDGSTAAGDNMNIFITSIFIISTLLLFYCLFLNIAKIATASETLYGLLLSWASYILLMIVNHLTAHYVEDVFMYNLTESFLSIAPWTNVLLPLISFIITIFVKSTEKKRPLSVKELSEGYNG